MMTTLKIGDRASLYSEAITCRVTGSIALQRLEPCAGKLARTVLRRGSGRNAVPLSDLSSWVFVGLEIGRYSPITSWFQFGNFPSLMILTIDFRHRSCAFAMNSGVQSF